MNALTLRLYANTVVNTYTSFMSDIKQQNAKGKIEMLLNYKNPVEFINTYGSMDKCLFLLMSGFVFSMGL